MGFIFCFEGHRSYWKVRSIVKNPNQSHPKAPWFHRIKRSGKIVVPNDTHAMQKVVKRGKNPCPRDLECKENVQIWVSPQGVIILKMKYRGGRHVGVCIVSGGHVKVKTKIYDECPFEEGLFPIVGSI